MGGGPLWPPYHESVRRFHRVRAKLTKTHDFVPLKNWKVPEESFFELFLKMFWKLDVENFWGSSSMSRKIEKISRPSQPSDRHWRLPTLFFNFNAVVSIVCINIPPYDRCAIATGSIVYTDTCWDEVLKCMGRVPWLWFLYGRVGMQSFVRQWFVKYVWEGGSDLCGRVAVIAGGESPCFQPL